MNAGTTPPPELHLPDLPEVAVSLGPLGPVAEERRRAPWSARLRDALSTYLPLLLMALLAGGTWWLVKHTPPLDAAAAAKGLRHEPDYTMRNFSLTRFAPDGRFAVRIEGDMLRHFPDTDRLEIDGVRIESASPDGRVTRASARRALANSDASEVQLIGAAHVTAQVGSGDVLDIEGEFLHAFVRFERLRSHLPVQVRRGGTLTHAAGLDYDHLNSALHLDGPVHTTLQPTTPRRATAR